MLSLDQRAPDPRLPDGPGWVRLRPELAGICGSDLGLAHGKISFVMTAFASAERAFLGHEVVGVVDQVGPGVSTLREGDRVVLDPLLSCRHRGFEACRSCREGVPHVCERVDQPGLPGLGAPMLGFGDGLGGGWSQLVVAHESQLHLVAGDLPSRRAVLAEPASVGLHAALRWRRRGDRAVVIGPGTIGLLVTAALRMLHPDLDIAVVSPGLFGDDQAMAAGASRTLRPGAAAVEALAAADGGRVLRPRLTKVPVLEQGVDVVFDCVGHPDTLDLGLHLLRPTGMLVLVGGAGKQPMDWSLVWNRELTVAGSTYSGLEPTLHGRHAMSEVVRWLADPAYPVDHLVTHSYPLAEWRQALRVASAGPRVGAVKVTLRPNLDLPLVPPSPDQMQR